jgi:hypothetical protein
MCRTQEESLTCNAHKSSLRSSRILDAEHAMYGHRHDVIHDKCKNCGAEFTDAEKDKHLNHSGSTEWAGVVEIRNPICRKCRDADPEKDYVGQCSYCDCYGCTKAIPRQHCGKGSVLVVSGCGSYVTGCRRHKKGTTLPTPHKHGDVRSYDPCKCAECLSKRR